MKELLEQVLSNSEARTADKLENIAYNNAPAAPWNVS